MKENISEKKNRKRTVIAVLGVLVIIAVILLLLRSCETGGKATADPEDSGIVYDPGATQGGWHEADLDQIVDGLNKKVEEGMINISMNTSPSFENGTAEGNLMMEEPLKQLELTELPVLAAAPAATAATAATAAMAAMAAMANLLRSNIPRLLDTP